MYAIDKSNVHKFAKYRKQQLLFKRVFFSIPVEYFSRNKRGMKSHCRATNTPFSSGQGWQVSPRSLYILCYSYQPPQTTQLLSQPIMLFLPRSYRPFSPSYLYSFRVMKANKKNKKKSYQSSVFSCAWRKAIFKSLLFTSCFRQAMPLCFAFLIQSMACRESRLQPSSFSHYYLLTRPHAFHIFHCLQHMEICSLTLSY